MTDKEVPSWLKYEDEPQVSASQVCPLSVRPVDAENVWTFGMLDASGCLHPESNCVQRKNMQKVEKASRKSRKRKTATYKEDEISHSSDLDSSTDEEAEVCSFWCIHSNLEALFSRVLICHSRPLQHVTFVPHCRQGRVQASPVDLVQRSVPQTSSPMMRQVEATKREPGQRAGVGARRRIRQMSQPMCLAPWWRTTTKTIVKCARMAATSYAAIFARVPTTRAAW
jgi:hypothetical protein